MLTKFQRNSEFSFHLLACEQQTHFRSSRSDDRYASAVRRLFTFPSRDSSGTGGVVVAVKTERGRGKF